MRYPAALKYLHERPLPRLPIWQPGNPRTRLFLPLYWLKMVEHESRLPKDTVKFECHWQMTIPDIKSYLEKLYQVPVLDVRIEIKQGGYMPHPKRPGSLSPPQEDRKYAYVQLREGEFKFPNIFEEKNPLEEDKKEAKAVINMKKQENNKNLGRFNMSRWFS
jgi:large subunit ribosomal protein L23